MFPIKLALLKMNSSPSVVQNITRINFIRSYSDVFKMLFGKFLLNSYGCDSQTEEVHDLQPLISRKSHDDWHKVKK
jgi:hypothetical protein